MVKEVVLNISEDLKGNFLPAEIRLRSRKTVTVPYTHSTIIFATNESDQQVVVKFPIEKNKAKREWTGLSKAYTAGVPTPVPIALVTNKDGQAGVMQEEVNGRNLYNYPDEQARMQLGRVVREMHYLVPTEGIEWQEKGKADYTYYDKLTRSWLEGQVELTRANSTTQALLSSLSPFMSIYCKSTPPRFNHNDIHDSQVIIRKHKVSLIDFEEWIEESPLNDVAYYLFHTIRTGMPEIYFWSFLSGYLGKEAFSEIEKQSLMFYLLFISARALNYFHTFRSEYLEMAAITHRDVTNYVDDEKLWIG